MHSKVRGVYDVRLSGIRSSSDVLERCGTNMKQISEEIKRIAWALPYDSVSGNYYRAKLLLLSTQVFSDGVKAGKCAVAGREAAGILEQAEKNVTAKFS